MPIRDYTCEKCLKRSLTMANKDEPAYPIKDHGNYGGTLEGLTKREYFAGLAMQAWISTTKGVGSNPDDVEYFRKCAAPNLIKISEILLETLEAEDKK